MLKKSLFLSLAVVALAGCSTVYPLKSVAKRTHDARSLSQDVRVDTASRDVGKVRSVAWGAYSVTFECEKKCEYTEEERKRLATEIAEVSFAALDRELRKALTVTSRSLTDVDSTVKQASFTSTEIKSDSYRTRLNRWLSKLGLNRPRDTKVSARGLKYLNPSEIGWSGEESLAVLGRKLGVDGVLVGHIRVRPDEEDEDNSRALIVEGPKVWLFSSHAFKSVVVAQLRPLWRIEPLSNDASVLSATEKATATPEMTLDLSGLDQLASGFGQRVAQVLSR